MYFNAERNRMIYFLIFLVTVIAGLMSRVYADLLPPLLSTYSGDVIWGFMVFIGMAFLFKKKSTYYIVIYALVFSFGIEYSQLLDNDLLNDLRATTLGGLVLGHGFLASDLVCYAIGILAGLFMELFKMRKRKR